MAIDLIDLVKGYLTPDVIQKAAGNVGESTSATQKSLAGIVPTLVGALANTASTNDGAQQLTRMLDTGKYDGSMLDNVGSLFGGGTTTQTAMNTGQGILDRLLGSKLGGVSDLLARFAGVRSDSVSSLLALVAPIVLHVLGKQRAVVGTSPGALAGLLGEQKNFLTGLVPAGLGSLLGWSGSASGISQAGASAVGAASSAVGAAARGVSDFGTSAAGAASRVTREMAEAVPTPSQPGWRIPLLIVGALIVAALAWLSWPTTAVREAARKISEVQLPGGVTISVPEGSFNFSVASWLFEDLNFETGSTQLTPESVGTVSSLVAVLTAYPAVNVALEGHTDNTGDPAANKKLSLDRATAVKDLMVKGGIGDARMTASGYGQENPVAPNDTDQGRAKNRRLEMVVVKR